LLNLNFLLKNKRELEEVKGETFNKSLKGLNDTCMYFCS
jgi:hypothetical protein